MRWSPQVSTAGPGAQPVRHGAGEDADRRLHDEGERGEREAEREHRQVGMLCRRRDELRQEGEVEDGHLRIGDVRDRAVDKEPRERSRRLGADDEACATGAQQADPEVQQVGRADELEGKKQPLRRAEDRAEASVARIV